jgi:hypothetical protein
LCVADVDVEAERVLTVAGFRASSAFMTVVAFDVVVVAGIKSGMVSAIFTFFSEYYRDVF